MRTTVVIEDRLLREAKQTAANRGITLSELVAESLRLALTGPVTPAVKFEMVTYGEQAAPLHRDPADLSTALDEGDRR